MGKSDKHELRAICPLCGDRMTVSELTCEESGVIIRGKFRLPKAATLASEHREFLEVFLRARGVISTVEKELGISYPTVRSRLDALLEAMDLSPIKEDRRKEKSVEAKRKVLEELEAGKITAEEAKRRLKSGESE